MLEQFKFTQVKIGGPISRDELKAALFRQSKDWHVEDSGATRANLAESAGRSVSSRRLRTVAELMRTVGASEAWEHIVLSDGLAAISVFIEPHQQRPVSQSGLARRGAINVYTRPVGNYWVTVVAKRLRKR